MDAMQGKQSENQKLTSSHEKSHLVRPCGETFTDNLGSEGAIREKNEINIGFRAQIGRKAHTKSDYAVDTDLVIGKTSKTVQKRMHMLRKKSLKKNSYFRRCNRHRLTTKVQTEEF